MHLIYAINNGAKLFVVSCKFGIVFSFNSLIPKDQAIKKDLIAFSSAALLGRLNSEYLLFFYIRFVDKREQQKWWHLF